MRRPISRPSPRTSASTEAWRSLSSASRCLSSQRILPHPIKKALAVDNVEHGIADRHRQRITAEGRAMRADGHALRASAVARQAPIGNPPPSAFASVMISGVTPVC